MTLRRDTASLLEGRCLRCGWPVVDCCVNGAMAMADPWQGEDYWMYCANPACVHHIGEGYLQADPDWYSPTPKEEI
jgi:hypothetical protein